MEKQEIKPIAMPGIHERFYPFFKKIAKNDRSLKILDAAAGHGAFTKKLFEEGYDISACDLFPEYFYFDKIKCLKSDLTHSFPYENSMFDIIIAMEVMEHINDHEVFFKECNRILKDNGKILISTPNILSLKSRIRFLFSGFFYSFKPLELKNYDGLQHVSSVTVDQYNYMGIKYGFKPLEYGIDKEQTTSKILLFLYPFLGLYSRVKKLKGNMHNTYKLLVGRVLFLVYEKISTV